MKIMVINPNSSKEMTAHLENVLSKVKRSDTQLTVTCPQCGPKAIESAYDEAMSVPEVLKLVKQANNENYDAIILACFSDPGLESVREISSTLVLGIQETSLHVACMLGAKFSVITMTSQRVPSKELAVYKLKLDRNLASVIPLDMSVSEIDSQPEKAKQRIEKVSRKAVEENGAEIIVLGCAGMAGYADDVEKKLGVTVLDPSHVTLKIAEGMVDAGLHASKRGLYAVPPSLRKS